MFRKLKAHRREQQVVLICGWMQIGMDKAIESIVNGCKIGYEMAPSDGTWRMTAAVRPDIVTCVATITARTTQASEALDRMAKLFQTQGHTATRLTPYILQIIPGNPLDGDD